MTKCTTSGLSVLLFSAFLLAAAPATAQDNADLHARAGNALQAQNWSEAALLYGELTELEPENGTAWYWLGQATLNAGGDTGRARNAYSKALDFGFIPGACYLGIAKSYAIDGDAALAYEALDQLAAQGPSPQAASLIRGDETFAAMAAEERFEAILTQLTPCTSEEYRQFDFWLGSWKVFSPAGLQVGTNVITSHLDGCALMENWTSTQGGKGMSINYYDRVAGTWTQIYRDNTGNIATWPNLVGGLVDGSMVLDSGPDTNPRTKWTWTLGDDGRVRQMAESTSDGGETWTVVWDSYYEKVDTP